MKTTFDLGSYTQPHDLRVSRDGSLLWVACAPAQKILEIDARSGKILKIWETKQEGGWMLAPTPDDRKIYVANLEGGSISVIDRIAGAIRTLPFRQGAIGIDCSPDGREVWVSCMNENVIAVVDNATGQIAATFDSQGKAPVRVKFTPDGKRALVVHGESKELSVFDAARRRLLTAIKLAESPKVITLSRDGRRAFLTNPSAHKMTVVDLTVNRVLDTFPVGKTPDGIAWSNAPLIGKSEIPFTAAFVNVNVIPMTREVVLANQTVVINDGRIAALGPFESTAIPDNAMKIDGRSRYLLPGLADLHIHLRSPDELLSYLAHGVTTVLHLSGAMSGAPDLLRYRVQIARGEMLGPTLYLSGPNVDGDPPIWRGVSVAVTTPDDARRVVTEQKRAGYDVIKVYNLLSPEAFTALAEAAKQNGIAVVGHVPRAVGIESALKAGQAMIAHSEEYFFTYFDCKECGRDRKPDAIAQTPAIWNGLPKGAYEVGFKFERQFDHARPFQNKYDQDGKIVKNRARPVQMFVWYPAARGANPKHLRYEEYLFLNDTEAEPWRWTDAQKLALRQKDGEEKQISGANWEAILALETAAVKDAKAAAGKFPLVIFGTGGGTGGHVYSVLCEYLASHGYVAVALTALPLKKGERWPFDASGIDAQRRDLEFAINYAYRLPFVDADKLALACWSVGGVTQALLQMRNSDVDALISLDAATGYEYGRDLLKPSIFLDFKKMKVPYMHTHGEGPVRYNVPKNFEYYDSLSVADAYLLTFKQLGHADFLACFGAVPQTILKTERSAAVIAGFKVLCQYVLNFLNAYLRGDKSSLDFLHSDSMVNGIQDGLVEIRAKLTKQ